MLHELNVAPQHDTQRRSAYTGPERRFTYRGNVTPNIRAEEILMDTHVIASEMISAKAVYRSQMQRLQNNIQTVLSIISFSGRHDRRKGTR